MEKASPEARILQTRKYVPQTLKSCVLGTLRKPSVQMKTRVSKQQEVTNKTGSTKTKREVTIKLGHTVRTSRQHQQVVKASPEAISYADVIK